ncbi:MAG TPA: glycoside hydrolase family 3 N-terminal domain-containing protein, partial [bacterium]|nr:glycoside hydrolase family 3 N-terminal domain-containing protein [bacterium]
MPLTKLKKTVGSLLVVGFEGHRVTDSLENFLQQWDLGGVILFKRNIESFEQVRELNRTIDVLAKAAPIVSVDHEGGRVFRLPEPFTAFPPMRLVGEACLRDGSGAAAEEVGRIFARELRAAGFNVDYAPVLDVDSNPLNPIIGDRAFSSDPEAASEAALSFWRGLEAEGVRGCGKHFPGHGDTREDSHLTLPVIDKPEKEMVLCEWVPFVKAIRAGIPLLMTAHVLFPALDKDWPA